MPVRSLIVLTFKTWAKYFTYLNPMLFSEYAQLTLSHIISARSDRVFSAELDFPRVMLVAFKFEMLTFGE